MPWSQKSTWIGIAFGIFLLCLSGNLCLSLSIYLLHNNRNVISFFWNNMWYLGVLIIISSNFVCGYFCYK